MRNDKLIELNKEELIQLVTRVMEHVSQPMIATSADRRLLYWNVAFSKLTGYNNKELSDPIISAGLTAPEWHESEIKALEKLQHTGKSQTFQKEYICKNGTRVPVEILIYQLGEENGKVEYYIGLITDITERKKLEGELQKSEAHYRNLVENAIEGIVVIQDGKIKFVNPIVALATGYTIEEMLSVPLKKFLCPDNEKAALESFSRAAVPGTVLVVPLLKVQAKGGGVRLIESTIVSILWDDRPANLNLLRDITEQYQAEETIRQSEKKYQSILEDISEGYWEVDVAGNFTSANNAVCRLIGFSENEIAGTNYRAYTSANDVDKIYQAFNQVYRTGEPIRNMHYQIVQKDGSKKFAETSVFPRKNDNGEIIGFRGVSHDITERMRVEDALRQSEEKYRSVLEHMEETYFELDLAGNFTFFNNALCLYFGYSREELTGMNYRAYVPTEHAETVAQAYNQVYRTGKTITSFSTQDIKKDGSRVDAEISISPLKNERGEIVGFRGVGRDITKRVQTEKSLMRSEEKYRSILEHMEEAYSEVDLAGNFTFFNNALRQHLGYSREELIGMNYKAYTSPANVKKVFQAYNQVYKTGEPIKIFAIEEIKKDGRQMVAEISVSPLRDEKGNITGFRELSRDVTERTRMEAALRRSEERYRTIMDEMHDDYFEVDLAGNYTFVNDAFCRSVGYVREEIIGESYTLTAPDDDAKKLYEVFHQIYITGQSSKNMSQIFIRKDGSCGDADLSAFPLRNEKGEIIGFRAVSHDVTERKQTEEALTKSEQRYRTILEDMQESYFETDLKGNYTLFNDAQCRQLGYTREEMIEINYKLITPPDRQKEVFKIYNQIYRTGEPNQLFQAEQIKKDGTRIPVEYSVFPVRDDRGEITGFRGVGRDITKRLQMEEALKQSEERYRTILDEMQDNYFEVDLAGNYKFVNDALCHGLGYTWDELLGKNFKLSTGSNDIKRIYEAFNQTYLTGQPTRALTYTFLRKDGSSGTGEMSAFPIRNDKGETIGFRGVSHDVTERVRMVEALRRSEERYRTLMEEMEEPYYEVDLTGNYTFFNDALCHSLGYSREEMKGITYKDYTAPDDIKKVFQYFNQVYRTGAPVKWFPSEQIRKDGGRNFSETSVFPLRNKEDKIIGFRGVSRDITERKQAEEEYRTIIHTAMDGFWLTDMQGHFLDVNEAYCKLIGYSREELLNMSIANVEEADSPEDVAEHIQKIKESGSDRFETKHRRKTGDIADVEISVNYLPVQNGRLFVSIRDISERKKSEEEKRQLEMKAQLASRLASVGELASGVAHEINNPLTGVIGYAHLLLARRDISKDVRHDLEIINEGAQRVAVIVKKLLSFARQTKPEQRYVNINELIGNTLELRAYELAASNIKVTLQLTRDMPMTIADPGQLQQVFLNLIINAETEMKLANDKGKLSIKTEKVDSTLRITFKDNGPGIARENLETIFDPFFTTREVGQGTGLGLSVCHGIITEHNGKIWAESELGKGASFIIELPLVSEEGQFEPPEPVIEEAPRVAKAKILVVDDEPVIRQLISQVLGEQGHTVETIDNAASALKMVKSKRYRLILLDIKMPGMSGVELYKQFQKIAPSLTKRVVFITGDVLGKRTMAFLDKTKTPCIMKPFDARELKTQLNRILARK